MAGLPQEQFEIIPALHAPDVAGAVIYALSTEPHVNVRLKFGNLRNIVRELVRILLYKTYV